MSISDNNPVNDFKCRIGLNNTHILACTSCGQVGIWNTRTSHLVRIQMCTTKRCHLRKSSTAEKKLSVKRSQLFPKNRQYESCLTTRQAEETRILQSTPERQQRAVFVQREVPDGVSQTRAWTVDHREHGTISRGLMLSKFKPSNPSEPAKFISL